MAQVIAAQQGPQSSSQTEHSLPDVHAPSPHTKPQSAWQLVSPALQTPSPHVTPHSAGQFISPGVQTPSPHTAPHSSGQPVSPGLHTPSPHTVDGQTAHSVLASCAHVLSHCPVQHEGRLWQTPEAQALQLAGSAWPVTHSECAHPEQAPHSSLAACTHWMSHPWVQHDGRLDAHTWAAHALHV